MFQNRVFWNCFKTIPFSRGVFLRVIVSFYFCRPLSTPSSAGLEVFHSWVTYILKFRIDGKLRKSVNWLFVCACWIQLHFLSTFCDNELNRVFSSQTLKIFLDVFLTNRDPENVCRMYLISKSHHFVRWALCFEIFWCFIWPQWSVMRWSFSAPLFLSTFFRRRSTSSSNGWLWSVLMSFMIFHASIFRSGENFSTTYAIVLFSPELSIKISNFSKTVRNIAKNGQKTTIFEHFSIFSNFLRFERTFMASLYSLICAISSKSYDWDSGESRKKD